MARLRLAGELREVLVEPAVAGRARGRPRGSPRCSPGNVSSVWPGHEPRRRDPLALEQLEDPRHADPRPELAVRQLHRRIATADAVGDGVAVERQGDGQRAGFGRRRARIGRATPYSWGDGSRRLLRGPRRRARRDRRGHQEGVPEARPAMAPGRQPGARGARAVQGDQRGVPGPVRPGAPAALRPVRHGRATEARRAGFGGRRLRGHLRRVLRRRGGGQRAARPAGGRLGPPLRPPDHVRGGDPRTEKEIEFPVLARCDTCGGNGAEAGHRSRSPARSATAAARSAASGTRCSAR